MFVRIGLMIVIVLAMMLPFGLLLAQETPTADVIEEPTVIATEPAPEVTPVPTVAPTEEPPPVEPPPEETPVTTPGELLGQLFSLLKDATYIAWASVGIPVIVGLLKVILGALGVNIVDSAAVLLTLVIQVLIWLGYAIANYFGAGEAFQRGFLIAVDIGRSLLPLGGAIFGAHMVYRASAKRAVPVMGYRANHIPNRAA